MVKNKIKDFNKLLLVGLAGLLLIITSEFFDISSLNILGMVVLAVFFVANSKSLAKRIEKIEQGGKTLESAI